MTKPTKIFFCVIPFFITLAIFMALKKDDKNTYRKETPKVELKKDESKEFEKYISDVNVKLDKIQKDQIIIKKDSKVYGPNELNENKKLLIKMIFLQKLKKELSNVSDQMNSGKVEIASKKINELFDSYKQKLYNTNNNMNLLDKIFLDNFNVYIQH
jgi:hypothetical protein